MPDKFIVPQFIDKEDKILGPITVRQFLITLGSVFAGFIEYKIFQFEYFIAIALLTVGLGAVFSFVKINGQPFHIFFVNFLQTQTRPKLRVWDKNPTTAELREARKLSMPPVVKKQQDVAAKERPTTSRLRDLSLVVNTGGVYQPDDDSLF